MRNVNNYRGKKAWMDRILDKDLKEVAEECVNDKIFQYKQYLLH